MTDLTRRQLLSIPLVVGGLEAVLGKELYAAPKSIKKRTITFEQAKNDPSLTARYISELLVEMFDEDEVRKYISAVKFFGGREAFFQQYPVETETDKEIAKQSGIIIAYDASRFANKVKSDIIVFPDIFKSRQVKIADKIIPIEITEDMIKAFLEHEFEHAKDNYLGIRLTNGAEINQNNRGRIYPEVYRFVYEARGYVKALTSIIRAEKAKPNDLFLGKIDETKQGYFWTIRDFATTVFQRAYQKINPRLLSPEESKLMTGQLDEIKAKFPELLIINQIRELYQRFK